jgi:sugar phosphate isomerase/epimerase
MVMGGADPMQYLARFRDRIVSFHLKDVKPDHSGDTELGRGVFDFKRFLAAVPALDEKPCYVEQEGPADELGAAGANYQYLRQLEF